MGNICKNWKKVWISLFVAMALVWCSMPQIGEAHEIYRELLETLEDVQGLIYSCYDSDGYLCAYVTGYSEDVADTVVIPEEINGYPVERVESQALKGSSIKELHLGNGVKQLGSNALEGCAQLTKIVFGSNVRELSSESFRGCTALQEIVIENNNCFEVIDSVLYEKMQGGYRRLILYPAGKTDSSFTLPAAVTGIDNLYYSPFGDNYYLQEILVEEGSPFTSVDGMLYSNEGTVLEACPASRSGMKEIEQDDVETETSPQGDQQSGSEQENNASSREDSKKDKDNAKKQKKRAALWLRLLKTIPVLLITWMALDLTRKGRKSGLKMYRVRRVVNGKTVEKIKKRWPLKTHIKTLIILVIAGWLVTQTMECGRPKKEETTNTPEYEQEMQNTDANDKEILSGNHGHEVGNFDNAQWKEAYDKLTKEEQQAYQDTMEIYQEVDEEMSRIFAPYLDDNGYVRLSERDDVLQEAYQYAIRLKNTGKIAACEKNRSNVYIRFHSGAGVAFVAEVEGLAAGNGSVQITSYEPEPWLDDEGWPWSDVFSLTVPTDVCANLPQYQYTMDNAFEADEINMYQLRNMTSHGILFWTGHGLYTDSFGPCLDTGIPVDELNAVMFFQDLMDGSLIWTKGQDRTYVITPHFFEKYLEDDALEHVIVYLGACYGGKDTRLADVLKQKGARTVFAFSDEVRIPYVALMTDVIRIMSEWGTGRESYAYPTALEALDLANQKHGEADNLGTIENNTTWKEGRLLCFGDKNARLVENGRLFMKVQDVYGKFMVEIVDVVKKGVDNVSFSMRSRDHGDVENLDVEMAEGEYVFTISEAGYLTQELTVQIKPGETVSYEVVMRSSIASCFDGGSGTKADPYRITSAESFCRMAEASEAGERFRGMYIQLENDISFADVDEGFQGIAYFSGKLNGKGHTIYDMHITKGSGLFHKLVDAEILNVSIDRSSVNSEVDAGAFAGYGSNSVIENCRNMAPVSGSQDVGGLVGRTDGNMRYTYCANYGMITSRNEKGTALNGAGGIVGHGGGTIEGCSNHGRIEGAQYNGGIVGVCSNGTITKCVNEGTIRRIAGGIVGLFGDGTVSECYNYGNVWIGVFGGGIVADMQGGMLYRCVQAGNFDTDGGLPYYYQQFDDDTYLLVGYPYSGHIQGCRVLDPADGEKEFPDFEYESGATDEPSEEETSQVKELTVWVASNNVAQTVGLEAYVNVTIIAQGEGYEMKELYGLLDGADISVSDSSVLSIQSRNPIMSNSEVEGSAAGSLFIGAKPHKTGTVTITITVGGQSVSCTVTVE